MSYSNPRITLDMSAMDVLVALSEGNPGALNVTLSILQSGAAIDPDDAFGAVGALLALDTHDIYGSDIWVLFKDVSGQNLVTMLGLLRAVQLGYMLEDDLKQMIQDVQLRSCRPDPAVVSGYVAQVCERLPNFGKSAQT